MVLQAFFDGLAFRRLLGAFFLHTFEQCGELGEWIIDTNLAVKPALVIDQLTRNLQLLFADAIKRLDLARVHNCSVEAGFHGIVQEHGIQHHARSWI